MEKENFTMYLIRSLILEYRLSLETVHELFSDTDNYSYDKIVDVDNKYLKNALKYVLDYETKGTLINQKTAKRKAMAFLTKFKMLKTAKEKVTLVNKLNDNSKIKELQKKFKTYTEDDIEQVIKFRYKYALSRLFMSEMLNITRMTIFKWEKEMDEEFLERLDVLNSYNDILQQRRLNSKNNQFNK